MDAGFQAISQGWLRQMTDFLQTLVKKQLVATGTEGLYMATEIRDNPGA